MLLPVRLERLERVPIMRVPKLVRADVPDAREGQELVVLCVVLVLLRRGRAMPPPTTLRAVPVPPHVAHAVVNATVQVQLLSIE